MSFKEYLVEDLGVFKNIPRDYLAPFRGVDWKLKSSVGKSSKVKSIPIKNAGNLFKEFEADNNVGMVIYNGNTPIFSFAREEVISRLGKKVGALSSSQFSYVYDGHHSKRVDATRIRSELRDLLKKYDLKDLRADSFTIDVERSKKEAERSKNKEDVLAFMSDKEIKQKFASDLKNKLAMFKKYKSNSYSSVNDAVSNAFEKEVPEILVIGNIAFNFNDSYNMGTIFRKNGPNTTGPYLYYNVSKEDKKQFKDLRRELENTYSGTISDNEFNLLLKKEYNELSGGLGNISAIKFFLKVEDMKIVIKGYEYVEAWF